MSSAPVASHRISSHHTEALTAGWQLLASAPGAFANAHDIPATDTHWREAKVPGTVAQAIHTDINASGFYDQQDWWYRTHFSAPALSDANGCRLRFEGLATLAEVWLNGTLILTSDNMFIVHSVDVTALLQTDNELTICFRSLSTQLDIKKPRPRWKTALTSHQNLRWFRTTLLGHIPSWCPPINPVGPWRPIVLEIFGDANITAIDLQTSVNSRTGIVDLTATVVGQTVTAATLFVGEHSQTVSVTAQNDSQQLRATLHYSDAPLWWPHTHGEPVLLPCRLELTTTSTVTNAISIDCGRIGFRSINIDRSNGGMRFLVNGVEVFCRGACWTNDDIISLTGTPESLQTALQLARDANMNMVRIGGTMVYESDRFYELCDELGILVWQDFMFANMDYPVGDANFLQSIETETSQQLQRLQSHPCVAAYCAGSEIEQQAAMMGLPASEWSNSFFAEILPSQCERLHAGVPYFRGSPCEGTLPFHLDTGIAHYYGIGAYKRPLSDAKHAGVHFTTECLGFSNVPDADTMALIYDGATPVPHHPRWKARVPRDNGTGWDFEDVRDFYAGELFGIDPIRLRSEDLERYYALSRVTTGEVMLRTFAEWRRANNPCAGGLVWLYKDLWPGAGWGIIDSENNPKAAYHYLRRAWAPRALLLTDDGLNGIKLQVFNEANMPLAATVQLECLQHGKISTISKTISIELTPRSSTELSAEAMAGHFIDSSYAYRFGPPNHDVVIGRLIDTSTQKTIAEDVYFPLGLLLPMRESAQIDTRASVDADGSIVISLSADCFLQSVYLSAKGYTPDENYFHLPPHCQKNIRFKAAPNCENKKFKSYLTALNLRDFVTIRSE